MGGKSKSSQRTKNNARPSSSGRSAGLLAGGAGVGGLLSALSLANDLPLPSELSIVFKKLHKKDPITKTKALQELSELASNSKVDDLEMALPLWTHHYRSLVHDNDRRVRELTQSCHHAVVAAVGRRVAPFIKRLLPCWLAACHEPHLPAALRARAALTAVFPGNRLTDALLYSRDDVIAALHDTLTQPLADNKKEANEEFEEALAASCRRVVCALGALGELVQVTQQDQGWLTDKVLPIINHANFWKLLQHSNEGVRAAWYGCCRWWCMVAARSEAPRVLRALLLRREAGHNDGLRWAAVRALTTRDQEWYTWVERREQFDARICALLETGGWGSARQLHEVMVPLLGSLPPDWLSDDFFRKYFDAAFRGLECKCVMYNKSERLAWTDLIAASIRLAAHSARPCAVSQAVRRWVTLALNHKAATQLTVSTATCLTSLLRHWLRQDSYDDIVRTAWCNIATVQPHHERPTDNTDTETQHERPADDTDTETRPADDTDTRDIVAAIERHLLLLRSMHDSFEGKPTRPVKKTLTFADDIHNDDSIENDSNNAAEDENHEVDVKTVDSPDTEGNNDKDTSDTKEEDEKEVKLLESISARFYHSLYAAVGRVSAHWLTYGQQHGLLAAVIGPLLGVVGALPSSVGVWAAVARELGASDVYQLYRMKVFPWLREESTACEELVSLLFHLMPLLDETQQADVYRTIDQCSDRVVQWVVSAVSVSTTRAQSMECSAVWARWVRGERASAALARAVCDMCYGEPAHMLPSAVLLVHASSLPSIASCVGASLQGVTAALVRGAAERGAPVPHTGGHSDPSNADPDEDVSMERLERVLAVCAVLGNALKARGMHQHTDLVTPLWTTLLYIPPEDGRLGRVSRVVAMEALTTLHASFTEEAHDKVIQDVTAQIHKYIYDSNEVSLPGLHHAASIACQLSYTALRAHTAARLSPALCTQLDALLASLCPPDWAAEVESHALRADIVAGRLSCPVPTGCIAIQRVYEESESNEVSELSKDTLMRYLKGLLFRAYLLNNVGGKHKDSNDGRDYTARGDDDDDDTADDVSECVGDADSDVIVENANQLEDPDDVSVSASIHLDTESCSESDSECIVLHCGEHWLVEHCLQLMHDKAVLEALMTHCGYWAHYDTVLLCGLRLSALCVDTVVAQCGRVRRALGRRLQHCATSQGYYWAQAAAHHAAQPPNHAQHAGDGYFHTLQAYGRVSSDETVRLSAAWAVVARAVHAALVAVTPTSPAVGQSDPAEAFTHAAQLAEDSEEARTDALLKVYYEHPEVFCIKYEHAQTAAWQCACASSALALYLSELVTSRGWDLPPAHIDLATLSLCALADAHWHTRTTHTTKMAMLVTSSLRLHDALSTFVASIRPRSILQQPSEHINALPREWDDVFQPTLTAQLTKLRHHALESAPAAVSSNHVLVMAALSVLPVQGLSPDTRTALLETAVARMAVCEAAATQTFAASIVCSMAEELAKDDESAVSAWSALQTEDPEESAGDEVPAARPRPELHAARLARCMHAALTAPDPLLPAHPRPALLLAEGLHRIAAAVISADTHDHYIHIYKEHGFIQPLVEVCLQWLPEDVQRYAHSNKLPAPQRRKPLFTESPTLSVTEHVSTGRVSALACRGLLTCLGGPGGVQARAWYGAASQTARHALQRVTAAYIAPHLIQAAIADVIAHVSDDIEDATAHATNDGEIVLALELDDRIIDLTVTMSPLHPLCPAVLSGSGVAAVPQHVSVLVARSPCLRRALLLWARAVTRRVEVSPVCYVCYCRLHPATGRLPSMPCRQCLNRFHAPCIRKWFQTSQKSRCPLCRTAF